MLTGETKMKATDRVFILKVMENKKAMNSSGLVDSRLFNGSNRLHAVKEVDTNLWYFKQDHGNTPPALKQKFTTFSLLKEHAEAYFKTRNVEIKEVID